MYGKTEKKLCSYFEEEQLEMRHQPCGHKLHGVFENVSARGHDLVNIALGFECAA